MDMSTSEENPTEASRRKLLGKMSLQEVQKILGNLQTRKTDLQNNITELKNKMEKSEKDRVPIGKEREAAKLLEDAKPAMVECAKGIIGVAKVVQSITEIGYWKEEPAGSGKG